MLLLFGIDISDEQLVTVILMCCDRELGGGVEVWNGLRVMENTPALKYQWPHSHCNNLLLRAINIDARNIVSLVS